MVFKIFRRILIIPALALLLGGAMGMVETNTWTVCGQGCDFTSIQAAIDAAAPSDTVIVNPETAIVFSQYVENIVIDKPIILEGRGDSPLIMAKDSGQPVILVESRVKGVIIRGFEISGGRTGISIEDDAQVIIQADSIDGNGVGIAIGAAQASIQDNFIYQNGKTGIRGGGISIGWTEGREEGAVEIIHNMISDNGGPGGGVGIEAFMPGESSSLAILDNSISRTIRGNGIWVVTEGRVEIRGNVIAGNEKDGIIASFGRVKLSNNVVAGNTGYGIEVIGEDVGLVANIVVSNDMDGIVLESAPDFVARFFVNGNQIRLNRRGLVLFLSSCDGDHFGDFEGAYTPSGETAEPFNGEIRGSDNIIEKNYQGDLCPEDYPWPEGFVKGSGNEGD